MDDPKWLDQRRKGIGGSDAAPILGLSPWKTAFQVWEEKLHLREGQEKTPAMSYGLMMEPVIRQWYSDETKRVVRLPNKILQHHKFTHMLASLDGITDDGRVLEIKTARSSKDWGEPGTDEIPEYYRPQVEHYLIVTGMEVADIAVSFSGSMPVLYEVSADKELQEIIIEKEAEFWALVETKTPPKPVTYSDMVARFRRSTALEVTASEPVLFAVNALKRIREEIKKHEEDEEYCKSVIMGELQDGDTLIDLEGNVLATWKQAKPGKRFDTKAFQFDHPELYATYLKESESSRRFLIK